VCGLLCCAVLRSSSSSSSSRLLRRERSRRSKREHGATPARLISPVNHLGRGSRSTSIRLTSPVNHVSGGSRSLADTSRGNEAVRHSGRGRSSPVHKAVSPAVALCMRAVYAAFLWHEGVVHDAMASASFLKFHPTLPKDLPSQWRTTTTTTATAAATTSFSTDELNTHDL